jgi:hypothetical protein
VSTSRACQPQSHEFIALSPPHITSEPLAPRDEPFKQLQFYPPPKREAPEPIVAPRYLPCYAQARDRASPPRYSLRILLGLPPQSRSTPRLRSIRPWPPAATPTSLTYPAGSPTAPRKSVPYANAPSASLTAATTVAAAGASFVQPAHQIRS